MSSMLLIPDSMISIILVPDIIFRKGPGQNDQNATLVLKYTIDILFIEKPVQNDHYVTYTRHLIMKEPGHNDKYAPCTRHPIY